MSKQIKATVQTTGVDGAHELTSGIDLDNAAPCTNRESMPTTLAAEEQRPAAGPG